MYRQNGIFIVNGFRLTIWGVDIIINTKFCFPRRFSINYMDVNEIQQPESKFIFSVFV